MSSGPISDAAGGIEAVLKVGGSNPVMRRAGDNIAFSLEVVTGLVKTALMPLAVVNSRAQAYFASKFPEDLAQRLADVPPESITSPLPSVAGPVMQGLNYSHEEEALRDLYLNLLATAMQTDKAPSAHPGFAEIIAALSAAEVLTLQSVLRVELVPVAELRMMIGDTTSYRVVHRHLAPFEVQGLPVVDPMTSAYIDNWVRLGLVTVDYGVFSSGEGAYSWVETRPEYREIKSSLADGQKLDYQRGVLSVTAFGVAFAKAAGASQNAP